MTLSDFSFFFGEESEAGLLSFPASNPSFRQIFTMVFLKVAEVDAIRAAS